MIERNSFQRLRLLCMALALLLALGACSNPFGVEPDEPLLWTPEESYEVTIEGGRAWATIPYIHLHQRHGEDRVRGRLRVAHFGKAGGRGVVAGVD